MFAISHSTTKPSTTIALMVIEVIVSIKRIRRVVDRIVLGSGDIRLVCCNRELTFGETGHMLDIGNVGFTKQRRNKQADIYKRNTSHNLTSSDISQ